MSPIYKLPPIVFSQAAVLPLAGEIVDWGLRFSGIPETWERTRGASVKVAVIDTGILPDHPDLTGAVDNFADFTKSRYGPIDTHGHGVHCAGIVGARANGRGVVGVAPMCRLMSAKALGDDGTGDDRAIVNALQWSRQGGADIASLSLGSPTPSDYMLAAIRELVADGMFVIAAAGNDGAVNSQNWPSRDPACIAVSAYGPGGVLADFSSRGPRIDVAAPGVKILSCAPGGGYQVMSGTSMATPFVAGVVALLIARHRDGQPHKTPLKTVGDLREHLARHAIDAGPVGRDTGYGYGLVNPRDLILKDDAPEPDKPPVVGSPCLADAPMSALLREIWRRVRGGRVAA